MELFVNQLETTLNKVNNNSTVNNTWSASCIRLSELDDEHELDSNQDNSQIEIKTNSDCASKKLPCHKLALEDLVYEGKKMNENNYSEICMRKKRG